MRYYDPVETGLRIKALRKKMGCTQETFSERLHTTRSHLAKLELGIRSPSLELLVDLSHLTGASLDYLILGKNTGNAQLKSSALALIQTLEQWTASLE